jgi:nitrate/nitrite transporter NarK
MMKLFLLAVLTFGAFIALVAFFPSTRETAFTVSGHAIPWFLLGVCGIGVVGWRAIK